jgi:hypothetical protein
MLPQKWTRELVRQLACELQLVLYLSRFQIPPVILKGAPCRNKKRFRN